MTSKSGAGTVGKRLHSKIAEALSGSLLASDEPFARDDLASAAAFLSAAAEQRQPGEATVAVESVNLGQRLTRIAVIQDDMPFLVDSIAAEVDRQGLAILRLVHPVLPVRRDADGRLLAIGGKAAASPESMVYLETQRADARTRRSLRGALAATLADVRAAVADWPKLRAAIAADAQALETQGCAEGAELLRWFEGGMLTQLGHVLRGRDGRVRQALGICRDERNALLSAESYERAAEWLEGRGGQAPLIVKSNRISRVHRAVPLDLFIVPVFSGKRVEALSVHAGLWTSAALAAPPSQVPCLRARLASEMTRLGFDPQSHDGKALVHAFTTLPHDLLIAFPDRDLERVTSAMMSLIDRPRPRLMLIGVPLARHLLAFVWLPRDALSSEVRLEVEAMLQQAAEAPVLDWSLEVEGNSLGLMRFVLDIRDGDPLPDEEALDVELKALVRGWPQAVEAELAGTETPARAAALASRFADAFPLSYRTAYGPAEAAMDIGRLRRLSAHGSGPSRRDARLYCPQGCPADRLHLKLYQRRGALDLSETVPMLEHFGFHVVGEMPTLLNAGALGSIHDFQLQLPLDLVGETLMARADAVEAAIAAVLNGTAEDDAFNRLITQPGLAAPETNWLRAWYRYLRQSTINFGIGTVVDALQNAPDVARGLIALFVARHDPHFAGDRARAEAKAQASIRDGLARVTGINDDRLLRQYQALVAAILRTNAFVPSGREALAFKLDSTSIPGLPRPVPWREITVYSRRVEGIHLRAGPVARGGLRWSDRRDDFRTEILGLMKAQRVKNAVIVPTGAKGGFYPKQLPDPARDREGWLAEGRESYKVFIRALLSLTDNIVGAKVVHPRGMVIRDGDDPYFVVAADKGTATFSDTANALAEERDFWLDDAFASGGSKGYDHKAMGITARGAWLSVQRHFLERGVDVQEQPIRVAGCGDMSGDVFGNGMLLSRAIKLVAAFDHRHVFLDPDPDPAKSWSERKRLFELPRSSWDDYDRKLISKGGGVFPRSLKQIELSPQVRAALGIDADALDPDALIHALLKAPVDLLWFGGIGTYVKSRAENNVQVGDPANDALRVDGAEVRAAVIGEGANLGCTQAGRIEFALIGNEGAGGRINTDFIDNSAGVDCSDNEVNIKIALASAKREGRLTEPARVKLLAAMTDDVAALVLEDNRLQALGLSIAEAAGAAATPSYIRLIEMLEERGELDRKTEGLADNETLARRAADGAGLTRPELAVLLSSAKLALQGALESSAVPDDPGLEDELLAAFPKAMRRKYIAGHRLRREIIATKIANRMINRLGLIPSFELTEEEGATLAQVGAAFVAAERLLGMAAIWRDLESAPMPEVARIHLFDRAASALRRQIADLLRAGAGHIPASRLVADLAPGMAALAKAAPDLIGSEVRAQSERLRGELAALGAREREARLVSNLFELDGGISMARLARDSGIAPRPLAAAFIDLGARLGLDWAQGTATRMNPSDTWERLLVAGLARDFQQMRLDFLRGRVPPKGDPAAVIERWAQEQAPAIAQFLGVLTRARAALAVSPAMLAQLATQARNLLARGELAARPH